VFVRAGGEWRQRTTLTPAVGHGRDDEDYVGSSVALDGTTALLGAWGDDDPTGFYGGAAYAFERVDGDWIPETRLAASDGDRTDVFGSDVALWSDRALVGAEHDEDPNGEDAGSAYLFGRDEAGEWRQTAKLVPADADPTDLFGTSVALSARRGFVGAIYGETEDGNTDAGSVSVFSV